MGSCDGLSDDSAVIWVRSATFACTFESRNALVGLVSTLTSTAAPAPAFCPTATVNAMFWKRLVVGSLHVQPAERVDCRCWRRSSLGSDRDDVDSGRARNAGLRPDGDAQPLCREVIDLRCVIPVGMSAVTFTPAARDLVRGADRGHSWSRWRR